ncbi:hypothetical protein R6Q57_011220 [Mikania cordata]
MKALGIINIAMSFKSAPKKVRGYSTKAQTWKMDSTQRIVVRFNKFGKPVRDEANELAQFLGTLVRVCDHVSIVYPDWRKVHAQNKEDMYSLVKSTCKAKRMSHSKMKEPHVSGTKSFARLAHEMAMKNHDVYLTRGEMYIKTQTRKDGTIVDDEASHAALKDIANDSTNTSDDQNDITNDAYSKGRKCVRVTDFSNLENIAV